MNTSKKTFLRLFLTLALFAVAFSARANTILNNSGTGLVGFTPDAITVGYDFTVGSSPIQITALGLWDNGLDGFGAAHTIGLWDSSGNLLASLVINAGTSASLSGEFRYSLLGSPISLTAGMTYVLGASFAANDPDFFKGNDAAHQAGFDSGIMSGNSREGFGGFTFPGTNFGPGSFVGPNAQFSGLTSVPESGPGLLTPTAFFATLLCLSRRCLQR